ncbi:MAG: polyisoprenoid-binding protein [Sterolibacteriaceae bacterium]|uniref:YceI family protein n=1 Tax=Sulfuritalea sp. TaxID=2480090 RepID=UPI001A3B2350|nr:YceI family protein [Sulfuritalea sp.]MBL8479920.1 polyisoprenoid-binding protein [Sterolibacteriaceae bacterium]MBN8475056.1 polyisoprenoid-binding protein [Sulfuritalea sp.]
MNKLAIVAAAALLSAFSASAFAAPETFNVEPTHTYPRFEYNHFGYSNQQQRFDRTSGKIVLDRGAHTGSVDVTIDATSVNTGYALFNQHIQAEDYFDTARFPTITFKSTKVKFEGGKPVAVDGNLTIKGVTRPVTLTVTSFHSMPHPMLKKDAIGANATTRVKRSDFNMGKNVPYVSDEVSLTIAVEAIKE